MKLNIIKEIKWKWMLFKLRFDMIPYEILQKYMRKNYCRYGIHKLYSSYEGRGGSNQRMKYVRFLKCRFCDYLFFAKKSDKKRYEEWHKKEKEMFSALMSATLSQKRNIIKKVSVADKGDVSSS